jgi:small subunit ribosomal protein S20
MKRVRSATVKEEAAKLLQQAVTVIDKAAQKGVLHKNNASRTKSRLSRFVGNLGKA